LIAGATGYTAVDGAAYRPAEPWQRFYAAAGGVMRSEGTVFLHERRTPAGERRLVGVDLLPFGLPIGLNLTDPVEGRLEPWGRVFTDGSFLRPPVEAFSPKQNPYRSWSLIGPPDRLRVFAGQPDPNDPSHFTIDYEVHGVRHTLDGWLRDDDTVVIEPRD
jgi:hypothetical protein